MTVDELLDAPQQEPSYQTRKVCGLLVAIIGTGIAYHTGFEYGVGETVTMLPGVLGTVASMAGYHNYLQVNTK